MICEQWVLLSQLSFFFFSRDFFSVFSLSLYKSISLTSLSLSDCISASLSMAAQRESRARATS